MGQLRLRLAGVATELSRWEAKLAKGLPATLKRGEFRRNGEGAVWQTVAKAKVGEASVPAVRYTEHPHTGRLRCTEEMGSLPAHRRGSQPCVVTTREPQPEAEQGAETARKVAAALDADEPHTALWRPTARRTCRTRAPWDGGRRRRPRRAGSCHSRAQGPRRCERCSWQRSGKCRECVRAWGQARGHARRANRRGEESPRGQNSQGPGPLGHPAGGGAAPKRDGAYSSLM